MRLPRMTTRRWMIIMVIIALLLEVAMTLRRDVDVTCRAGPDLRRDPPRQAAGCFGMIEP